LTANSEHALRVGGEGCANDVLTMSRVALGRVSIVDCRVAESINETPVVAGDDELAIWADLDLINVGAILARWVHTLDVPAKLDCRRCPDKVFRVGETGLVLCLISDVEVQFLVVSTHCAHIGRV